MIRQIYKKLYTLEELSQMFATGMNHPAVPQHVFDAVESKFD